MCWGEKAEQGVKFPLPLAPGEPRAASSISRWAFCFLELQNKQPSLRRKSSQLDPQAWTGPNAHTGTCTQEQEEGGVGRTTLACSGLHAQGMRLAEGPLSGAIYLAGQGERGGGGGGLRRLRGRELPGRLVGKVDSPAGDHTQQQRQERGQPRLGRRGRRTDRQVHGTDSREEISVNR